MGRSIVPLTASFAVRPPRSPDGLDLRLMAAVALGTVAIYVAFPWTGDHPWDALFTASALAGPEHLGWGESLFSLRALVLPLTYPFYVATGDGLLAVALRETLFAGLNGAWVYLGVRLLTRSRLAGLLAATAVLVIHERWRMVTLGGNGEVGVFFAALFALMFLHDRDALELGWDRWVLYSARWRGVVLGCLAALAVTAHVGNSVVLVLALPDLLGRRHRRSTLWMLGTLLGLLGVALVAWRLFAGALPFLPEWWLLGLASPPGPGGDGASGQGVQRLAAALAGLRAWFTGLPVAGGRGLQAVAVGALLLYLLVRGVRCLPAVGLRLMLWLAALLLHGVYAAPEDLALWGRAMWPLMVLALSGVLAEGRHHVGWRVAVLAAVVALGAVDGEALHSQRAAAWALHPDVRSAAGNSAPVADIARWIDGHVSQDAVIVVGRAIWVPYFHIYTPRRPTMRRDAEALAWAARFPRLYAPPVETATLRTLLGAGHPVYLLTASADPLDEAVELGWQGMRWGRWIDPAPPAEPGDSPSP